MNIMDAQIELMAEYAYRILGANRELAFEKQLKQLASPQMLLYSSKKAYRDHLYHLIDVCLLGHLLLLVKWKPPGKRNKEYLFFPSNRSNEERRERIQKWYVISLFHDIGYTLGLLKNANHYLSYLDSPEINAFKNEINKGFRNASEAFKEIFKNYDNYGACADNDDSDPSDDHAIISACHVRSIMQNTEMGELFISENRECLEAIMLHESYKRRIDVKKNPFAFLLLLCDRAQEWGRPRIQITDLTRKFSISLRHEHIFEPKKFSMGRYCGVNLNVRIVKNNEWDIELDQKSKSLTNTLIFYLKHQPAPDEEPQEVVPGWMKLCSDFSKIENLDKIKFPSVIFISSHPISGRLSRFDCQSSEMELFKCFCNSSEKGYYLFELMKNIQFLNETPIKTQIGKSPFQYFYAENDEDGRFEEFIVTLKDWEKSKGRLPKILHRLPSTYYSDFASWKKEWMESGKT
ncbi:hypothetical protein JW926_13045 [Candidatus Sumerlaeota bacterium]|nr:hypothetical protein [Candidatus Sumerlaeota bacterium]